MKLTPDQWHIVSDLLDQALELPPSQRSNWLAQMPAIAPEVGEALRDVLEREAQAETEGLFRTLPKLGEGAGAGVGRQAGDTVGGYRLLRELGRGGMGTVWLAERMDGMLKRAVALKLPHLSGEAGALRERFARERDILAGLAHPNIAQLYDAGLTADRQPFLALEVVEGRSLLDECAARRLGLQQRLDLFAQVLEAIQYAHSHLVVHRDLKPSNILVTGEGQVKLLDFGIAKLLADGTASETELTQLGGRAMTPDYASPEQILGQPITTATDVYSLGVLLFELLCGERPYRLKRTSRAALEEAIVAAEPAAPSGLVRDRSLARELRGDLDTIALKALKKKPEQRYQSAAALAEDLRRHRTRLPVLAQADTRWYRWSRFLVRNWIPVSAIAGAFMALVAGTGIALWQARSAQLAQARGDEVKGFIASIFTDTRPAQGQGGMASAAELLMRASDRVPRELAANPHVGAELDRIIGDGLANLGELGKAREHLERALKRDRAALGEHDLAVLRVQSLLADVYLNQGQSEAAEPLLIAAAGDLRRLGRAGARDLVEALRDVAVIQWGRGGDQGLVTAREGVEVADRWLAPDDPQRLVALATLGENLRVRDRYTEALAVAQRAADLARRLFGSQRPNPMLAHAEDNLAYALSVSGRPAEAVALARQALRDISALQSGEGEDVNWAATVLARALNESGQLNEAQDFERRSIKMLADQAAGPSTNLAIAYQRLGETQLEARRPEEALAQMRIADQMTTAAGRQISPRWARDMQLDRAEALTDLARIDEATALMDAVSSQLGADPSHQWARVAELRTRALRLGGQGSAAIDPASAALRRAQDENLGPRTGAALRVALAQALLDTGQAQAARPLLVEALARYQAAQVGLSPRVADALVGLGRADLELGNPNAALASLKQTHEFWLRFDPGSLWAAEATAWYGRALLAAGQGDQGRALVEQARSRLLRSPFPPHRQLAMAGSPLRN